jgi:hypothetical protein
MEFSNQVGKKGRNKKEQEEKEKEKEKGGKVGRAKRGGCFWSRAEMSPFCRSFMRYGDLCVSVLLVAIQDVKFRSRTRYKYISNTRVRCARM